MLACCLQNLSQISVSYSPEMSPVGYLVVLACELNISCTSTTAEARAKIWYH